MNRSTLMWIARIVLISMVIALFSTTLTAAWLDFQWLMYKHADKVGHFLGMFFIASASLLAFPSVRAARVFVYTAALAGIIELGQLFGPRSADIVDFSTGLAGILFSASVFHMSDIRKWMLGEPR